MEYLTQFKKFFF